MAGGVKGKQKEDQVRVVNPEEVTGHDDKQLLEVLGQKKGQNKFQMVSSELMIPETKIYSL